MSSVAALPPYLRQQMTSLARRIRLLRGLRGGSLLLLVLAITASAAGAADYCVGLPKTARLTLFIAWACLGISLAVRVLGVPLCRKLGPDTLAALVEEKHPELGERLTTAVELAGKPRD